MSDTSSTTAGGDLIQQARIPVDEAFSLKVREFYEQDEMSMRQIAATLQVPRRWIAQALHDSGVAVSSRGAGRRRRRSRVIQPPMLRETLVRLYVQERLTRAEVATKLDVPESRVRTWLRDLNLPVRSRGGMSREDRKRLPKKPLIALYVKEEMSADRVGERLGSIRRVVLASAPSTAFRCDQAVFRTTRVLSWYWMRSTMIRKWSQFCTGMRCRSSTTAVPRPIDFRSQFV